MRANKHKIAFFAEDGEGTYDELAVDFYNRYYEFKYKTEEKFLYAKGNAVPEIKLCQKDLNKIYDTIKFLYSGEEGPGVYLTEAEIEKRESGKPVIDKLTLWKAIKRELPEQELDRIISFDYRYEKDDYYDYKIITDGIHCAMAGDITVDYFKSWLILLMRCLNDNTLKNREVQAEYAALADWFDGFAFMDQCIEKSKKLKECREIIAVVKYANHKIKTLKMGKITDFTTNGVITYVAFAFSLNDGKTCVYRVCVVDKKRRRINYMYSNGIDYREDINYTIFSEEEFDDLSSKYVEGYTLDTQMDAEYAANNG